MTIQSLSLKSLPYIMMVFNCYFVPCKYISARIAGAVAVTVAWLEHAVYLMFSPPF